MGEFLVKLVEIIMRIWTESPSHRRFYVLGADYEKREEKRTALWVGGIIVGLFLAYELFMYWVRHS